MKISSTVRGLEETAAAIAIQSDKSFFLMCRRVDQLLVEKDRGLYQWFLRQDAFGHGERKDKMGESLEGDWRRRRNKERERKNVFLLFYCTFRSLVALLDRVFIGLGPN